MSTQQHFTADLTPEQARAALAASEQSPVTHRDRTKLGWGVLLLGLAVGAVEIGIRATIGDLGASKALRVGGFGAAMAIYVAAVSIGVALMQSAKSSPRGFTKAYGGGFGASMALYAAFIAVHSIVTARGSEMPWWVVALAAVVTALPAVIAGAWVLRGAK